MNRQKKLVLNTSTSLLLQIVTVICGFVLPRIILETYGSEVNGLVNSITQFLSIIAFLELGVGAVVQSSLYKPLAKKDNDSISAVITSGDNFFKRLAFILVGYVLILVCFYPLLVIDKFDWLYTALLIIAISISSFAQYYFGVIDRLLLSADQRGYIQYFSQIITLIINTTACCFLMRSGASIQMVKLTTSLIFLIRPLLIRIYINKSYKINRNYKYSKEPIEQKWNGIAQHVAAVVLDNTDTIILTMLSTLSNVSIYSVYHLIIYGVKKFFTSLISGIQSLLGDMIAKGETTKLSNFFSLVEFGIHTAVVYLFTCTAVLVIPFVSVYTKGITDVNYIQPLFAILITAAHAGHCLRLPYNIVILASGHYRQTQSNYIIAAVLNIGISAITVWIWGLVGVAIGTLVAMVYQTIWMAIYDSKNIIYWPIKNFIKQCIVDFITITLIVVCTSWIKLAEVSYKAWIIMACKVSIMALAIIVIMSVIFNKKAVKLLFRYLKRQR